jgi:hypothetical protein
MSIKTGHRFAAILFAIATSCLAADELPLRLQQALDAITTDGLLAHIKILASDEFEGRAPGTKGEEQGKARCDTRKMNRTGKSDVISC